MNTFIKSQWISWHKSRRESKKLQVGWSAQRLSKLITFESQRPEFLSWKIQNYMCFSFPWSLVLSSVQHIRAMCTDCNLYTECKDVFMFSLHKQLLTVSHKLSIAIIPCNYFLYIFCERYYLSELAVLPACLYFFNKDKMKILQGGRVFGDVSVIIAGQRKHPHKMISLFSKEKVPDEFSSFMFLVQHLLIYIVVISYRKFPGNKYFDLWCVLHSHFPKLP